MRLGPLPLCLLVVTAAACGGGDRLSREEYVAKADAICEKYGKQLDALPEPQTVAEVAGVAERALPIARKGVDELRRLEPPEELESKVDDWLARDAKNVQAIENLRDAAKDGDPAKIRSIVAESAANEKKADALAREIGLAKCAEGR